MGCRKNLTRLTAAERLAFTNAINQLRADGGYDTYVQQQVRELREIARGLQLRVR